MRIAITGATGFLGRQLVAQLAPEHDLVCISRGGAAPPECTAKKIDIVKGRGLKAAFAKVDVVIHSAGLVSHEQERAQDTWAVHVKGTENVLKAARSAGVKRVVYLSTSGTIAVSDDPDFLGTEESPAPEALIASWPYYRSKRYAEQLALEMEDIELICLNPSLLLGPGDEPGGVSTHSVQVFLDEGVPVAPSGGISFVDVRDVVNAVESALTRGTPGHRYLLAGGNMSFLEFYSRLARVTGRDAPMMAMPAITRKALGWFPKWGRKSGISAGVGAVVSRVDMELASHYWYADSSKAANELGWTPRGPTETLEDTVFDILEGRTRAFQMYR
jgi:dihydroflavonol-4-reductase